MVKGRNIEADNVIASGANVFFKTGESITLREGFHVVAGSSFSAKIGSCIEETEFNPPNFSESRLHKVSLPNKTVDLKVYPNPFQAQTTIQYRLPESGRINIQLRDFLGRPIKVLVDANNEKAGLQKIQLNAENLPTGTYFIILNHNGQLTSQKIILLK